MRPASFRSLVQCRRFAAGRGPCIPDIPIGAPPESLRIRYIGKNAPDTLIDGATAFFWSCLNPKRALHVPLAVRFKDSSSSAILLFPRFTKCGRAFKTPISTENQRPAESSLRLLGRFRRPHKDARISNTHLRHQVAGQCFLMSMA